MSTTTALTSPTTNTLQDLFYVSGIFGFIWVSYIKYRELKLLRMSVGLNTLQFGSNIVRRLSNWGNSVLPSIQRYLQAPSMSNLRNNRNYSDLIQSQLLLNQNNSSNSTTTPMPSSSNNSNASDTLANRENVRNRLPNNVTNPQTQTQISTSNNGNIITATTTGELELDGEQIMNMLLGFGGLTNRNSNNRDRDRERTRNRDRSNTNETSNDRTRPRGDSSLTATTNTTATITAANNTSSN